MSWRRAASAAQQAPLTLMQVRRELAQIADIEDLSGLAIIRFLHDEACRRGLHCYQDPATGYTVMTAVKLEQRPCCGNGCRHCPWEHANVPASLKGRCPPPITRDSNAANADGAGT